MRWPPALQRIFDDARGPRRRASLVVGIAAVAVVVAIVAIPLQNAIGRLREDVVRNRLLLDIARARTVENAALARIDAPAKHVDLRATVDSILTEHGLRYAHVDTQTDGEQRIVVEAAPFDALVRALDALAHVDAVRVADVALTARVDPGTVRAELTFTR